MTQFYKRDAEDGNWRVRLRIRKDRDNSDIAVYAQERRLMIRLPRFETSGVYEQDILVHVRTPSLPPLPENAPGGTHVTLNPREAESPTWRGSVELSSTDDSSTIEVLSCVRDTHAPTIFLAGDSTVTDQKDPQYASWGQMLPCLLGSEVAVANHAEFGETLKSFASSLRLAKILSFACKGDILVLQFCHNDQKQQWPQTWADADSTYPAWLRVYIEEARLRRITPVLATAPERLGFGAGGKILPSHGKYPDAVRKIASREIIPLLDLEKLSIALYESVGEEHANLLFAPGDKTHHSQCGAWLLAKCAARELCRTLPALTRRFETNYAGYKPDERDFIETLGTIHQNNTISTPRYR